MRGDGEKCLSSATLGRGKGYREFGLSFFSTGFFSPMVMSRVQNTLTFALANSECVWRAHGWDSSKNMISNDGDQIEKWLG